MIRRLLPALIIPALDEEPVIGDLLKAVPAGLFHTIIVADNGSTDRTAEIAEQNGAVVVRQPERGYGAACLKALEALGPEIGVLVFIQADLSENPREAGTLLIPILEGRADLVIGSRVLGRVEQGALLPHQRFGNWLATTLMRVLYGYRYTDLGAFRAVRRDSIELMNMRERNYGWTVEMQVRAVELGLRILEVPVSYKVRAAGVNKVSGNLRASLLAGWRIISTLFRLRFRSWRRAAAWRAASN